MNIDGRHFILRPDDEAFIRGILANPGDDAPRLIYADWLEERDDPRGAYLRAESEWEKTHMRGGSKENHP